MEKRVEWHLENWEINKLKPYAKNPRIITEKGLEQLKSSFDDIGFAQPININTDGTILSGHARWQQLKREGAKTVDVYVPNKTLTPKQEEAVIVRMNKNTAGVWDFDVLANEFDLDDLTEWGFDPDSLEILDAEEVGLPNLGDGSDSMIKQMTFTVSTEQADIIDEALKKVKKEHQCIDEINENSNGNALAEIMRQYVN